MDDFFRKPIHGRNFTDLNGPRMPTDIAGVDNKDLACCSACSYEQAALECCGGSLCFRLW
jgi:hypothetical protein